MSDPPGSNRPSGGHSLYDDDDEAGTVVDASLFATPEIPEYPAIGTMGHFEILGRIARGGMAEIFLARERATEGSVRHVVLKRVLPEFEDNEEFLRMFLDEGRMATRLYHAHVCHVYECGEIDGSTFMALEWVHGVPLRKIIRVAFERSGIPIPVAIKIIGHVASALHYVHNAKGTDGRPLNIIHRDVSPHNVMVAWDGNVKLLDFGIAKTSSKKSETDAGVLKGKYSYMAPEQARGREVDARADIFALGICLYETLTGKPLYHRETVLNTLTAVTDEPVPSAREVNPDVPFELDRVLQKTLQKDPDDRYQTAGELQDALEDVLIGMREYVDPTRIALFLNSIFDEADKQPLPTTSAKATTGSHPALTPSGVQSGSFGPFGQAPRPVQASTPIAGAAAAGPASVVVEGIPSSASSVPAAKPESRPFIPLWLLTLVFIVLGLAAGVAVAMLLR